MNYIPTYFQECHQTKITFAKLDLPQYVSELPVLTGGDNPPFYYLEHGSSFFLGCC